MVRCKCDANPKISEYKIYVNGKVKSVNKSLSLADHSPGDFSCSGTNEMGSGNSSSQYFQKDQANTIVGLVCGIAVCCLLVAGLIPVNVYIFKKRRKTMPSLSLASHTPTTRRTSGQPYIMECPQRRIPPRESSTVIGDSVDIYAEVYANAPKDKFVKLNEIYFGKKLKTSNHLNRWKGKLKSIRDVVISSPPENASPITQLQWASFVKNLIDLPKVLHIVDVKGICIEKGNFYLLQEYMRTGTLRKFLVSIQYTSVSRETEFKPTCNILLELASSLVQGIDFILRQQFYHPGLCSDKVLVADGNVCKLYDFCTVDSVKDRIDEIAIKVKEGTSARTLPPEAVFKRMYDKASEMWSLAATVWEIFSYGQKAKFNYLKELSLQDPLQGECKLKKPQNMNNDIYDLMARCWSNQPSSRPKIFQLKQAIDETINGSNGKAKNTDSVLSQDYEPMTGRAKIS